MFGANLLPIERMTLLTVHVDGVEYKHTQYTDVCYVRNVSSKRT